VTLRLASPGDLSLSVVDRGGDIVRRLASDRRAARGAVVRLSWDGSTDAGHRAPDGRYRYRVTLPAQGRSALVPGFARLDTTPPRPEVVSVGPDPGPRPELVPVPGPGGAAVTLRAPGTHPVIRLFQTSPGPERLVLRAALPDGSTTWHWNGRLAGGRPAQPGTYVVSIQTTDRAGNIGVSPALDRRGLPAAGYGARLAGHGGITVRYLGVMPPSVPVKAGGRAEFGVDARQRAWTWMVNRVGARRTMRPQRATNARLRFRAPGAGGVYILQVRTARSRALVPFAVQGRGRRPVLVVLPVMTWQGRNLIDDDGDGLPNVLDRGVGADATRVYAGGGLPSGFASREAPLLHWLDENKHRYDVTTDVALAAGVGPSLRGHKGVILPSDVRWLPEDLQQRLRAFVRGGGGLATFGVDSLRRQVTLTRAGQLADPTPPATTDLFGARLGPLHALPRPSRVVEAADTIEFFAGSTGAFGPFAAVQEVTSLGARPLATAVTEDPQTGRPVIAAERVGHGVVVRYGVPGIGRLLARRDPQVGALMERTWTLLAH
jgi:N,N-dimethylformamidase beta subunit-like protein/flagellar hook capping protein FlgD